MNLNNFGIVTPNLNMRSYLEETIESVLINIKRDDRYFIIDGGSTDGSIEIIQKYSKWLTGWITEKDKGYADALRKGFEKTKDCTFQYWLNSGDLLLPNSLQKARALLSQGTVDLIYGSDIAINDDNKILQVTNGNLSNLKDSMLFAGMTPLQDACFWRRDLYDRVGGIRSEFKYAADFDIFLRMAHQGTVLYSDYIFSAFRVHNRQKSVAFSCSYDQEKIMSRSLMLKEDMHKLVALKQIYYWFSIRIHNYFFRKHPINKMFVGKDLTDFIKNSRILLNAN
jgi:glycosyltransferase involved in cell wall biosynthesis